METTRLYKLISKSTRESLTEATHLIQSLPEEDVCARSEKDGSTYLHHLVTKATDLYNKNDKDLTPVVPLIYRLALKGVSVNAQNTHGNTCLHLACIRPHAEPLCIHLIRIGADPCVLNKKGCRVIHTYSKRQCVLVKGQATANSGLWNAVEKEDMEGIERLMQMWCRVNIKKNTKSLNEVADETGNIEVLKLVEKHDMVMEMIINALACYPDKVKELIKAAKLQPTQEDRSFDPPKPLVVAVKELGKIGDEVAKVLVNAGAVDGTDYEIKVQNGKHQFENSEFFELLNGDATEENFIKALDLIDIADGVNGKVGNVHVNCVSHSEERECWTFLHFVVDKYNSIVDDKEELSRILVRMVYRLALAGIDVNARDANGYTPLLRAATKLDQNMMTHIIRVGGDSSLCTSDGCAVNQETYEDKGKLVFDKKYRPADQPGLWVAVDTKDITKAERWLKSWSRVKIKRGDRSLIEIARSLQQNEIVQLFEKYMHYNEFVCATFACLPDRMMDIIALGNGKQKVNTIDDFFHVGFTFDRHAEYMARPIIVSAVELCPPKVVDFLLEYKADLSSQHEESPPCGPITFWAFRDHVDNKNTEVVARYADVALRDELGATMLHMAIKKNRREGKSDIVQILLDRGIDVAARDSEGSTARDYLDIYGIPDADELRQVIDNHVLEMVANEELYWLETLLLDDYDHIDDIRGTKRNKTAREISELKEYKEIVSLIDDKDTYRGQIDLILNAAKTGDLVTISKLADEKRCAAGKDKGGRSLLHIAVLYEHKEIVRFLVEQYPNLINARDNILRTPLHYCVCLEKRRGIWSHLQDGGADPNLIDGNNLSVYDYVRELENPTPTNLRPRGRRWRDYRPSQLIAEERGKNYGAKAELYVVFSQLKKAIKTEGLTDIKTITQKFQGSLANDDLDKALLKQCVDDRREEIAKHLITNCGARPDVLFTADGASGEATLVDYARAAKLEDLVEFLESLTKKPETLEQEAS